MVYAAYGGIFIVPSILWGLKIDKIAPNATGLIGSAHNVRMIEGFDYVYRLKDGRLNHNS
jgi:drug/metabolite transporter superfamily protein YnfA